MNFGGILAQKSITSASLNPQRALVKRSFPEGPQ